MIYMFGAESEGNYTLSSNLQGGNLNQIKLPVHTNIELYVKGFCLPPLAPIKPLTLEGALNKFSPTKYQK